MTDEPLTECDEHGTPVQRVFHPVAVHFKGSGFYNTDYGKKKSAANASEGSGSSEGSSSTKSDSSDSGSSEKKAKDTSSGSSSKTAKSD